MDGIEYCVSLGNVVGPFTVSWNITAIDPGASVVIDVVYDGVTYTSGSQSASGSYQVPKPSNTPTQAGVTITAINGEVTVQVNVSCPEPTELQIIQVVVTDNIDAGKYIHAEYGYTDTPYISPVTSNLVTFASGAANPLVSLYSTVTGNQGSGSIPTNGSTVSIISNKINFDDFDFNPTTNKFKWLRTNVLFNNNPGDIASLLSAANNATPIIGTSPTYLANFVLPNNSLPILYLIWDLRSPVEAELCYSDVDIFDACCGCTDCQELCSTYEITAGGLFTSTVRYADCETEVPIFLDLNPLETITVCSAVTPLLISGTATITFIQCGCPS